jgi:hypothetical protein
MDRQEILSWLTAHPDQVRGDPSELVERCEQATLRHAAEDAWLAARDYVLERMHQWEAMWGFHASEEHVAREICPMLARELQQHEPRPRVGDEAHFAGEDLLRTLGPAARERVVDWILSLATDEEHRAWREVVRFTRRHGRDLIRAGRVSRDGSWEATENYRSKAAHVAELLARDLERLARTAGYAATSR